MFGKALVAVLLALFLRGASAAEYQWSLPVPSKPDSRAFLWIPPDCEKVRAVVIAQNNMIEQNILEHPAFRKKLTELGIAEIWIAPPSEMIFDFTKGASENFAALLQALAAESGYQELAFAPVAPLAHSACASYPWNFAASNPGRTLAAISVHGDAPLTRQTGSGKPNPDWENRTIEGVPGLMAMGEYEWAEDRIEPALAYKKAHPQTPLAMLAEPGHGHFDVSDHLVNYLGLFLQKAAAERLPQDTPLDRAPVLRPIDPKNGWLVERWHLNQGRQIPAAPFADYTGDHDDAFWAFDQEMALATQNFLADQPKKKPQLVGFAQQDQDAKTGQSLQQVALHFAPLEDGISFHVSGLFVDHVGSESTNLARWTYLLAGSPLGHATGSGPVVISRITGPVVQTAPETFAVSLNRASATADQRNLDVWLLASHPGDANYKSAVQQASFRLSINTEGREQTITFPTIPNQKAGTLTIDLAATSDAGVPVSYYVREGPAEVTRNILKISALPPRAKFPVKVTVVAWQWGNQHDPKLKMAQPVVQTFQIVK